MASRDDFKRSVVAAFIPKVMRQGLRVFIAEKGTHGFFTDAEGTRVVSFQVDFGSIALGGNYQTDNPARHGKGWRMDEFRDDMDLNRVLKADAPHWAVRGTDWVKYATLEQHLAEYQQACGYTEVARLQEVGS